MSWMLQDFLVWSTSFIILAALVSHLSDKTVYEVVKPLAQSL